MSGNERLKSKGLPSPLIGVLLLLGSLGLSAPAKAGFSSFYPLPWPELEYSHSYLQTSIWTTHFSPDPEHNNTQNLISLEVHNPDRWLAGVSWFKNSFDQPTWYFYVGHEFPLWRSEQDLEVRAKLSAGFIRGYKGEYQNKIPFNDFGVAPAALPSIGVRWRAVEADVIVFGVAGMMVTAGMRF
ncbi:hypothetical protein CAI21_19195 [Alkalilimnicola ehrlichii]|uniref:Sn-glycerol-3-phosphate transporter n=2 Tax=Alkalilimnicola ehrlichii TaxID=351052 RepID=A0A3E0WKF2_9GAMM|nr:hypothetical protein CAI21_19195 [Alkalilimnicola ehrlichii]RFA32567.1 hypothetical protein CAL65_19465 [Alkalilimnicola ehrlichii]